MSDQPTPEEFAKWQRRFAAHCNNRAWELASQDERTMADGKEMLLAAYASAYHWSKAGTPLNDARAEITIAHAYALLGDGPQAMYYAQSALGFFESGQGEDWDLAFAHLEIAQAAAIQGDEEQYRRHYYLARDLGEAIQDEEDRQIFLQELQRIPHP
jgi:hypothetical protein